MPVAVTPNESVQHCTASFVNVRISGCPIFSCHEPSRLLLDRDLIRRVIVPPAERQSIVDRVRRDSLFLADHKVMDYR